MTEWGVVLVIASLSTLFVLLAKPLVNLVRVIAELTTMVDELADKICRINDDNKDSHKRLWEYNGIQDRRLNEHDTEITVIKSKIELQHEVE